MKKLLFVIDSLYCGGAEKSLVSLLNNIDYKNYSVDLMMLKRGGDFERLLPENVNILESPKYYRYLNGEEQSNLIFKFYYLFKRVKIHLEIKVNQRKRRKKIQPVQIIYKNIKKIIEENLKQYDGAIGYSQGFPTYYIVDKVKSKKKIAWINCDYPTTLYDKDFDYNYYKKIDSIVAVSKYSLNGINNMKYNYSEKTQLIYDIVDPKIIRLLSKEAMEEEFDKNKFNIVTVGRLDTVKGYDLAIQAAYRLKKFDVNFRWYAIGEGRDRELFEELIKRYKLEERFILLGSRCNPYPYMRKCDLYVQTSKKEGFGLTVMEAKILNKTIVCTDFTTSGELIKDSEGYIVSRDYKELAMLINKLYKNRELIESTENFLKASIPYSTVSEVNKVYKLLN